MDTCWLRATVVVDVANLAFSIPGPKGRAARGRSLRWGPDLGAVRDLFHHLGIEVTSFRVGLPLEPVEVLGVAARPEARRQTLDRARQWLGEQRAVHGDELVQPLPGASDGNGELGVDAACVLEAIAVSWDPTVDAVIVMSEDTDVMVAQDYVTDTPILAAGRFGSRQRQALRAEHRGWIDLREAMLETLAGRGGERGVRSLPPVRLVDGADADLGADTAASDTGRFLAWKEHGSLVRLSSDLDAALRTEPQQRRRQAVDGAATVAVTDPYDLSVSAARAIGIAKLPTPATVEELLASLGFDLPIAQFAAVPDIVDRLLANTDLAQLHRRALEQLDEELEAVIAAHRDDGDVRTQVSVGRLAIERDGAIDPDLRRIEEKKVATTLAADTLWALRHTDLPVVVLSDRPELAFLLERMTRYVPDAHDRIVRVGLHARPVRDPSTPSPAGRGDHLDEDSRRDLASLRVLLPADRRQEQLVVLNGHCTAELTGLTRQLHGPALLAAIHRELADEAVEWRMVRFDATSLGAVLSPVERPEIEIVFHRMLELNSDVATHLAAGGLAPAGALQVALSSNDAHPCELPTLRHGTQPTGGHDLAVVIEHRDGTLHLDIDGDTVPDIAIAVSHGAEAYRPGQTVIYRTDTDQPKLLGPLAPAAAPQRPLVVIAGDDGTATDPDTNHASALLPLPETNTPPPAGSRLLAYPCTDGRYQALSTSLPHL